MKEGKKLEKKRSRYKRALRAVFLLLSYSFFITRWCNIYFFCFCTYNSSSSRWLNGWKWLWLISLLFTVSLYIYLGAWWSFQLHFQNLQQRFWLNGKNLKDLTEYDQSKCVLAGASLVAQMVKNLLTEEPKWDPWVTKTPGEENGNPLQYSCHGEFHGQRLHSSGSQRIGEWLTLSLSKDFFHL